MPDVAETSLKHMAGAERLLLFFMLENPWLCQGFKKALAMDKKLLLIY